MKIHFENVGRDHLSWSAEIEDVTYRRLLAEIRKKKALASRDVEFDFAEDGMSGNVIVGGWRPIGRFSLEGAIAMPNIIILPETS